MELVKRMQRRFLKIKSCLFSDISRVHFDAECEIIVASDTSNHGIGTVILYIFEDETTKPIAHASRNLLPVEIIYSQIDKESDHNQRCKKKFHKYIFGRKFTLQTDHRPLLTIFGFKKGIPTHTTNRLQLWGIIL